ncbi:MAG: FeoB-associated Cys-rich membrane protein [Bacteroidales bacterium]|nr:FeoB-associated Cys-rich membrane protein [Candidatus Sodaliphilus aphodohippi]
MIQTLTALFIVAVALIWVLLRLRKASKSDCKSHDCAGCGKHNCPTRQ